MIVKALNLYRIIHKNGITEDINAENISVAIENMTITEEESPVICIDMVSSDIRTIVEEETEEDTDDENTDDTEPDTEIGGDVDIEGNV